MIRIKDGNDCYDPDKIDGWFVSFFSFDKEGNRVSAPVPVDIKMQPEMQEIPFELVILGDCILRIHCCFLAGFVGLSQNEKSKSLKPEIAWFIKEEILKDRCIEILNSYNSFSRKSIKKVICELKSLAERHKSDPFVEDVLKKCHELELEAELLPKYDESDDDIIIENENLNGEDDTEIRDLENKNEDVKDQSNKPKKPSKCCILI